jgi:uncharacterized protein with HEPN domain
MTDKALRAGDYLGHMLDAISQIRAYTAGLDEASFRDTRLVQDAVVGNIEILCEAAQNIRKHCPDLSLKHHDVPWQDIYGMRNRLSHGYFEVNYRAVWQVVVRELPILEPRIRAIAAELVSP